MSDRRVVITGLGVVSPIGLGKDGFWQALIAGKSGIRPITAFDTSDYPCHNGGQVWDFNPDDYLSKESTKRMGRASQFAAATAGMAIEDAGLSGRLDPERTGVSLGSTNGEAGVMEAVSDVWIKERWQQINPHLIAQYPPQLIPANVAIEFGIEGPVVMMPNACAAGNWAIGHAYDLIRSGDVDVMLAGGTDPISRAAFVGFSRTFSMTKDLCQPFDKNRKGMLVSEGAATLLLEDLDCARKRGARIYAEIAAYGLSCDAHHITGPHPEGLGAARAMRNALAGSGLSDDDIDYISAHGTGTKANDKVETLAIKSVFREHAKKIPVSSIKSMMGHTMGAASAIEAVACALALSEGIIPPTINFSEPDPDCDLDCVPNEARDYKAEAILSNSFAFGGNCSVLALRKWR